MVPTSSAPSSTASPNGMAWWPPTSSTSISCRARTPCGAPTSRACSADAEAGAFEVLLCYDTSRFARNIEDAYTYRRRLAQPASRSSSAPTA